MKAEQGAYTEHYRGKQTLPGSGITRVATIGPDHSKKESAGHRVLTWMARNCVCRQDQNENITPAKRNSTGRIKDRGLDHRRESRGGGGIHRWRRYCLRRCVSREVRRMVTVSLEGYQFL